MSALAVLAAAGGAVVMLAGVLALALCCIVGAMALVVRPWDARIER
jgi:hypothetical protein